MPSIALPPEAVPPARYHLAWLHPTRTLANRIAGEVADALLRLATRVGHDLVLICGFCGSAVAPLVLQTRLEDESFSVTWSSRTFDALTNASGFLMLPDPAAADEALSTTALGAAGAELIAEEITPGEALHLSLAAHAAMLDHVAAVVADAPKTRHPLGRPPADEPPNAPFARRSSKAWIYDLLAHLPGLTGCDHSAALLVPDHLESTGPQEQRHYVVAAERLYAADGLAHPRVDHLVGLLIPCEGGHGGLLEAALAEVRRDPTEPFHLFVPSVDDEMDRWRQLSHHDGDDALIHRFHVDATRDQERMLVLVPLAIPGDLPAFLSLNYRHPMPISAATVAVFGRIVERLSDALTHCDLFRLSAERLELFEAFAAAAAASPCTSRREFVFHLMPELYARLGAASASLGLIEIEEAGREALVFENPQGWDLDQPHRIATRSTDSLAALAMRMRRSIVLAGGHPVMAGAPAIRWNNALMVNEGKGRIADHRMRGAVSEPFDAAHGWRPLSDYYKPTTSLAIYVGVAVPLIVGDRVIGVLSLDFDRTAPWTAYSGFASERLYHTLARLVASHLALLPA